MSLQEPVRVVIDEDTYRRRTPSITTNFESPSQDYGFPDEENLVNEDQKPFDTTLLRCFPELGVFSLRDRQWGKYEPGLFLAFFLIILV